MFGSGVRTFVRTIWKITRWQYLGNGSKRRLRGGCHHNWDLHCRVWWRYGIEADAHDGCIGFRLVLAPLHNIESVETE
jgi:hypothetical protein